VVRCLQIQNKDKITAETKEIRVKIAVEEGFDPHMNMDIQSLWLGASEEIDVGIGSSVLKTEKRART